MKCWVPVVVIIMGILWSGAPVRLTRMMVSITCTICCLTTSRITNQTESTTPNTPTTQTDNPPTHT